MITNKSYKVCYQGIESKDTFNIKNGLQQGSVNTPLLFNLYILDLLKKSTNIISFADDIIIYHADKSVESISKEIQLKFDIV